MGGGGRGGGGGGVGGFSLRSHDFRGGGRKRSQSEYEGGTVDT